MPRECHGSAPSTKHARQRILRSMQRMGSKVAWVLAATTMMSGCYLSYRLGDEASVDGSVPDASSSDASATDAPRPPDASPAGGAYWVLEPRGARVSFRNELGCTAFGGGTLALTVTVPLLSTCEHGGPVDLVDSADGTRVVHANVWVERRRVGDPMGCTPFSGSEERHVTFDAVEGEVLVRDALSGMEARVRVAASLGDPVCSGLGTTDAACSFDCDCGPGLLCIPSLGDFVECFGGNCGQPCDLESAVVPTVYDRDTACPATMACTDRGLASPTCGARVDTCGTGSCSEGLSCPISSLLLRCDWDLRLAAETRHPCTDERDCDPGMHCVEHGDSTRTRTCEVPCFMNTMNCPPMHACQGAASGWVCEWLGE